MPATRGPTKTSTPSSGALWLHEIKHDGFRVIARKDGPRVRLYSRPGNDLSRRFPSIVETLARLRSLYAISYSARRLNKTSGHMIAQFAATFLEGPVFP